jgi:hypothetical protein
MAHVHRNAHRLGEIITHENPAGMWLGWSKLHTNVVAAPVSKSMHFGGVS